MQIYISCLPHATRRLLEHKNLHSSSGMARLRNCMNLQFKILCSQSLTLYSMYILTLKFSRHKRDVKLMFIGPCIIAIVDEWKTNLMTLAILFHLLCAQHVSDINISIFRSLRLCSWITTSVVLFSVLCVLELLVQAVFGGVRFAGWSTLVSRTFSSLEDNLKMASRGRNMQLSIIVIKTS